jgi:methionyl-tRNA synthetase
MTPDPIDPVCYTITSALPYANGPLHIGHLAGAYLSADIYVRHLRAQHKRVVFVCGTDEYGAAILLRARKEGITPQEIIDKYHGQIKTTFEGLGISFDIFSRTSRPIHHETAQSFFRVFYQNHLLERQETQQLFDPEARQFLPDRYVTGECPKCGNPNAYGDQCERCGSTLSPTDLINPKSTLTGAVPEIRSTAHWFLPLDRYQQVIEQYLASHPEWKPNVSGQVQSWLADGLQPRAITRDLDWGIPLPAEVPDSQGKVLYVWFDAPIGYISATREYFAAQGNPQGWKDHWLKQPGKPAPHLIHFIGKDNIVFHTIIFPAILHGHGPDTPGQDEGYVLPTNVPANEFLNLEGQKLSTSRNWAIWVHEYLEDPDLGHRVDELRYVLTSIMPESKDSDFSWKDYQTRVNSELVNILGNFINRVVTLIHKYYAGAVPTPDLTPEAQAWFAEVQQNQVQSCATALHLIHQSLDGFRFREALGTAMNLAREGNQFLQTHEPWKLVKTAPERTQAVLVLGLQYAAALAEAFQPFLPGTALKIRHLCGCTGPAVAGHYPIASALPPAELLFTYIEDAVIERQLARLRATPDDTRPPATETPSPPLMPAKPTIGYEDFERMDLRVATVLAAVPVPKTDKLLQLTLDTGIDQRTVVSGIAQYYTPEALVGRQVLILANLAPRKLKGIESQGMILMAQAPDGSLVLMQPATPQPNGSIVK